MIYIVIQGSQYRKFGAEIWPHSQSQKVYFFTNSRWKIPNLSVFGSGKLQV